LISPCKVDVAHQNGVRSDSEFAVNFGEEEMSQESYLFEPLATRDGEWDMKAKGQVLPREHL